MGERDQERIKHKIGTAELSPAVQDRIINQKGAIYKAKAILVEAHPFLGSVLLKLPLEVVTEATHPFVTTAAVDQKGRCYVNLAFSERMNLPEKRAVLLHEALHLALQVFEREGSRHPGLWNVAHDYAINLMIDEEMKVTNGLMSWPKSKDGPNAGKPDVLLDEKFKGLAAEEIYERVLDDVQKKKEQGGSGAGKGQPVPGGAAETGAGDSGDGSGTGDAPGKGFPDATDVIRTEDGSGGEAVDPEVRDYWREVLASAYEYALRQEAKGIGKTPGWAKALVDDILTPMIPWATRLAHRIHGRLAGKRRTFAKVGRRSHACGVSMPGAYKDRGCVGVFMDVSGSIEDDTLVRFATEIYGILSMARCSVRVITWDTEVHDDLVYESADEFMDAVRARRFVVEGRGGTDFRCVQTYLRDDMNPDLPVPNFGVLLTDGMVGWTPLAEWPIDVLVVYTEHAPDAGYGYDAIRLDEAKPRRAAGA
jgi:predicted metal-dependent peptidase